jgi:AcrR family transcriptional regulator
MSSVAADLLTPEPPRTQAERTALAAASMIDAAIALINSQGIEGATLKAIGESAGYSRGLATHHFGSKAGLFRQLLRQVHAEFIGDLNERVGELTGVAALEVANETHRDWVLGQPDRLRAMYILWFGSLDPGSEFKPNVARFMERQRETMAGWIRDGQQSGEIPANIDADRMALQLYASLIGINHQWLVNPQLDLQQAYRDMKTNMLRLLQPDGSDPASTRAG